MDLTHHAPRQSPCHERETQKQHQPRLPSNTRPAITIAIGAQPTLLNAVDNEHAKTAAYARNPVDELDVDVGAVTQRGAIG